MRRYIVVIVFVMLGSIASGPHSKGLELPLDYRNWWHVKSMILLEGHPLFESFGGIHHVYANDKAWNAIKTGKVPFPDGAIFVFDLFEAPEKDHAISEGSRKVTAIMVKNSKKYKETEGWGFQAYAKGDPENPIVTDPVNQCFSCHTSQKDKDYVFSGYRQ